ncbi:polysaccharide deacetylase family protein [Kineococcus sp. NUM-3379]
MFEQFRARVRRRPAVRRATVLAAAGALAAGVVLPAAVPDAATPAAAATCTGYVALTFDDGPIAGSTDALLTALRSAGARATLFNTGQNAAANPSLVRAQVGAGMWVGNHSYTHPDMTRLSSSQMASEISRTQTAIQNAGAPAPKLFRPPYGATNATLRSVEQQHGLREVLWDVDSQDWNGAGTAQIVAAADRLTAGQVMLLHDGYRTTVDAIPQIVRNLGTRGLCAGMISPSTGRAVAPDSVPSPTPTTSPGPTAGTCSAAYTTSATYGDRYNGSVTVSGTNSWVATVRLTSPQKVSSVWNGTASWDSSGYVMTVRPNGSGNTFGFTVMHNGNSTARPAVSCAAG